MGLPASNPDTPRRELLLGMLQAEYPNYHPLVSIARIAHNEMADLKLQFECHKTISKYVEPELKSIEVKGEINGRHRVSVSLFEPVEGEYSEVGLPDGSSARSLPAYNTPQGQFLEGQFEEVDRKVAGW